MILKFIRFENKNVNVRNNKTSKILFSIQVRENWRKQEKAIGKI